MKPFRFRLARVLRLRQIREQEASASYGAAETQAVRGEDSRALALDSVLQGLNTSREQRAQPDLDVSSVLSAERALDELRQQLAFRRVRAAELRAEAEAARAAWQKAHADVEGLERLEERDRDRQRLEQEQAEQSEMDERTSSRFGRRSPSSQRDQPQQDPPATPKRPA